MRIRLALLLFLTFICPHQISAQTAVVRVAVASSLMPAMQEIKTQFESQHELRLELIPGASGTLANQALHGAPFDLFISANQKYCHVLDSKGLLSFEARDWAQGALSLWSIQEIQNLTPDLSSKRIADHLKQPEVKTIAIAQPGLAPYGDASKTYLQEMGVYGEVKPKLIFGNSISITNQYIYTGGAHAVITSLASQITLSDQVNGFWYRLDTKEDLIQSVCVLKGSHPKATETLEFLFDNQSFRILESYGYLRL